MKWEEVRAEYPNEWLVVEAIRFHEEDDVFVGDDITVVEKCPDGAAAFAAYRRLHRVYPAREFIFVHTSRPDLRVEERRWQFGLKMNGILGLDVLFRAGAVLDLGNLTIKFSA